MTLPDGMIFSLENKVAIERKSGLDEICKNFTSERKRFVNEFVRAAQLNAKIYLLIENSSWEKVKYGSYRSNMSSESLVGSLTTWLSRYNCQILFCKPETTS